MESPESLLRQETSRLSSSIDALDEWIIDHSSNAPFGQSEYQCRNFVLESHPTKYSAIRQACLEISTREQGIKKIRIAKRKSDTRIKILEKDKKAEPDELKKELIQCEIDLEWIDNKVWEKKLLQGYQEQGYFLSYIKELPSIVTSVNFLAVPPFFVIRVAVTDSPETTFDVNALLPSNLKLTTKSEEASPR